MRTFNVSGSLAVSTQGKGPESATRTIYWDDTTILFIDCPEPQAGPIAALSYATIMAARCKASGRFYGHCSMSVSCTRLW